MDIIKKYFPDLTESQYEKYDRMYDLYQDWNSKINVISRKDFEHFYERHVLHSLAIAKYYQFEPGMRILDVGTGGGFPGIPLAVMFPETKFTLVDSIQKKIKVVENVAEALQLDNVKAQNARVETLNAKFDVVISRAVTVLPTFCSWIANKVNTYKSFPFVIYLKGGDVEQELKDLQYADFVHNLSEKFEEEFFETKKLVCLFK